MLDYDYLPAAAAGSFEVADFPSAAGLLESRGLRDRLRDDTESRAAGERDRLSLSNRLRVCLVESTPLSWLFF
jgi:hypothetical protein